MFDFYAFITISIMFALKKEQEDEEDFHKKSIIQPKELSFIDNRRAQVRVYHDRYNNNNVYD